MIQMRSILEVADNSGAKKLGCIKVLGGTRRRYATLGDIIVVSVKMPCPIPKSKKDLWFGRSSSEQRKRSNVLMVPTSNLMIIQPFSSILKGNPLALESLVLSPEN